MTQRETGLEWSFGEAISRGRLALRVPTCIDEEETIESASESDASSSSRTTGFECEFVVSIGQTFSHWVHDCKVCAPTPWWPVRAPFVSCRAFR